MTGSVCLVDCGIVVVFGSFVLIVTFSVPLPDVVTLGIEYGVNDVRVAVDIGYRLAGVAVVYFVKLKDGTNVFVCVAAGARLVVGARAGLLVEATSPEDVV